MSKEGYFAFGLGVLAIITVVLQKMYPVIPPLIGWPIVGGLGLLSIILFRKGINKKLDKQEVVQDTVTVALHPKKHLNFRDRNALRNIDMRMTELHRHSDRRAMESELLRGVSASDLIKMNCTICFKPRGQRSDDEYE